VEEWLGNRGIEEVSDLASPLVAIGLDIRALDRLEALLGKAALPASLAWAARAQSVYALSNQIHHGSARVSEIVGALKHYSFLGQAPVQSVNLHEGIDDTLVILQGDLERGVSVRREYASDLPPVEAHGLELNQVWTNILHNAIDAMEGAGELTIRTRRDGNEAVVEIEDNGPGIPHANQARVFDPFFTTKPPGKGTGLGLSTSYTIVKDKHSGTIAVESRPGRTVFTVRLPIKR
jgi:signal transduction histidine kinase